MKKIRFPLTQTVITRRERNVMTRSGANLKSIKFKRVEQLDVRRIGRFHFTCRYLRVRKRQNRQIVSSHYSDVLRSS